VIGDFQDPYGAVIFSVSSLSLFPTADDAEEEEKGEAMLRLRVVGSGGGGRRRGFECRVFLFTEKMGRRRPRRERVTQRAAVAAVVIGRVIDGGVFFV